MKVHVWDYVEELTSNYHSGGGLVIVTDKDPQEEWDAYVTDYNNETSNRYGHYPTDIVLPAPDVVYEVTGDVSSKVFVFPDSGCC